MLTHRGGKSGRNPWKSNRNQRKAVSAFDVTRETTRGPVSYAPLR
jgi:hypothetical protein